MSLKHCPGVKDIVKPSQIIIRTCPECSEEVEFFSDETESKCPGCGRTMHREASPSCVSWCQHWKKCIADLTERGIIPSTRAKELEETAKKTNPHALKNKW